MTKVTPSEELKFYCTMCQYCTTKSSNLIKHNKTKKHINKINLKLTNELKNYYEELENRNKELENRNKELETLNNEIMIKYKQLKKSYQELEIDNKINEKIKDMMCEQLEISSNTGTINNNNTIYNIILNTNEAPKCYKSIAGKTIDILSHNYDSYVAKEILSDVINKLCNAYLV